MNGWEDVVDGSRDQEGCQEEGADGELAAPAEHVGQVEVDEQGVLVVVADWRLSVVISFQVR